MLSSIHLIFVNILEETQFFLQFCSDIHKICCVYQVQSAFFVYFGLVSCYQRFYLQKLKELKKSRQNHPRNDHLVFSMQIIWDKVFKNRPSEILGRQPLKKFDKKYHLKTVFRKFHLVYSWILCPISRFTEIHLKPTNAKTSRWVFCRVEAYLTDWHLHAYFRMKIKKKKIKIKTEFKYLYSCITLLYKALVRFQHVP